MSGQYFSGIIFFRAVCRNKNGDYFLCKIDNKWKFPEYNFSKNDTFEEQATEKITQLTERDIKKKGILKIEHAVSKYEVTNLKIKIIFYFEIDSQKNINDNNCWISAKKCIANEKNEFSKDVLFWINYLEIGGIVYPMEFFDDEGSEPKNNLKNVFKIS